mmetsp:Transcript_429/g.978  ORF Transcript_429/g.978 Transcript_429/m.978 type:complete len:575 (+) Transcript_429:254-1978(+)
MSTLKFLFMLGTALLMYALALRRMNMSSDSLPHARSNREHIHDSYLDGVLHLLHLENGDGGAQTSAYFPAPVADPPPHLPARLDSRDEAARALRPDRPVYQGSAERMGAADPHLDAYHAKPGLAQQPYSQARAVPVPRAQAPVDHTLQHPLRLAANAGHAPARAGTFSLPQDSSRAGAPYLSRAKQPPPRPSPPPSPPKSPLAQSLASNALPAASSPRDSTKANPPAGTSSCGQFGAWKHGRCVCNRLHAGAHCERRVDLSRFKVLQKIQSDFKGAITMSKRGLAGKRVLRVFLPGKEKDPDKGNRVLGRVTSGLVAAVEDDDIFRQKIFDKCAVVGSSGILHHFDLGSEIDNHDMVLRFNSAPTKGFERLVGSKTTHRITNTQNWVFRESDSEHIMVHMRSASSVTAVIRTHIGDKKVKLAPFDTDFVHYMANSLPFMATSGLYGIIIALHHCAEVDLYGFQVSNQHGMKYHYYNVCDQPANAERDGDEWHVVKAIVQSGLARFREPCIIECHESKAECERCKASTQLKRVTSYGKAERGRCPRCSTQYGGCRPPQHWAFRRRWTPPRGHSRR